MTCAWRMSLHLHTPVWTLQDPFTSQVQRKVTEKNTENAYICLFTCASTRAVHLDLLHDLGVKSFLQAFRRFSGRRDLPSMLVSDNARTFKAGWKEVEKIVSSQKVQHHLSNNRVTWKFIVEQTPWLGWGVGGGGGGSGRGWYKVWKMPQEDSGENISRLRWIEYSTSGNNRHHQLKTSHLRLWRWWVYFAVLHHPFWSVAAKSASILK